MNIKVSTFLFISIVCSSLAIKIIDNIPWVTRINQEDPKTVDFNIESSNPNEYETSSDSIDKSKNLNKNLIKQSTIFETLINFSKLFSRRYPLFVKKLIKTLKNTEALICSNDNNERFEPIELIEAASSIMQIFSKN